MARYQIGTPKGYMGEIFTADSTEAAIAKVEAPPIGEKVLDVTDWQAEDGSPVILLVVADEPETAECPKHGQQRISDSGSFIGFAGGRSYYVTLACGCTDLDETNDINAAY